jgi:hypothetical protein
MSVKWPASRERSFEPRLVKAGSLEQCLRGRNASVLDKYVDVRIRTFTGLVIEK